MTRAWLLLVAAVAACAPPDDLGQNVEDLAGSNGLRLTNGLNLPNGFRLENGMRLSNGLNLSNGVNLANGINLANGAVLSNGIRGPYFAPPSGSALEQWIDVDPPMRTRILKYLVQCALPSSVSVQLLYRGTLESLGTGVANLGPGFQLGPMSSPEQEKVSACLLARVNARGEVVTIDMVGPFPAMSTSTSQEASTYTLEEAFFGGNLFLSKPLAYLWYPSMYANGCVARACLQPDGSCNCGIITPLPISSTTSTGSRTNTIDKTTSYPCNSEAMSLADGTWNLSYRWNCTDDKGNIWPNVITTWLAPLSVGASCVNFMQCQSHYCAASNTCQLKTAGMACQSNSECLSGSCDSSSTSCR